jgi:hypothetical protein
MYACSSVRDYNEAMKSNKGTNQSFQYIGSMKRNELMPGAAFGYVLIDVIPRDASAKIYIDNILESTTEQARRGIRVTAANDHSLEIRRDDRSCKFRIHLTPDERQSISCRLEEHER